MDTLKGCRQKDSSCLSESTSGKSPFSIFLSFAFFSCFGAGNLIACSRLQNPCQVAHPMFRLSMHLMVHLNADYNGQEILEASKKIFSMWQRREGWSLVGEAGRRTLAGRRSGQRGTALSVSGIADCPAGKCKRLEHVYRVWSFISVHLQQVLQVYFMFD